MDGPVWTQRERVRFRDCDAMGHVNNAVFSTYLEEARIGVLGGLEPFILARVEIDFRAQLRAGEQVTVRTWCPRIGTKSFDLAHEIQGNSGLVAEAKSPRRVRLRARAERAALGRAEGALDLTGR